MAEAAIGAYSMSDQSMRQYYPSWITVAPFYGAIQRDARYTGDNHMAVDDANAGSDVLFVVVGWLSAWLLVELFLWLCADELSLSLAKFALVPDPVPLWLI